MFRPSIGGHVFFVPLWMFGLVLLPSLYNTVNKKGGIAALFHKPKADDQPEVVKNPAEIDAREPVNVLAVSRDGKMLATAGYGETVRIWDVATHTELHSFREARPGATFELSVTTVAFSPDGKTLAAGYLDGTLKLWDVVYGTVRVRLRPHQAAINALAFSPDGVQLASGSGRKQAGRDQEDTGEVRLWDAVTLQPRGTIKGHRAAVTCLAFTPDGSTLAVGDQEGFLKLWDAATAVERGMLWADGRPVLGIAYSPDGQVLAAGYGPAAVAGPSQIKLWDTVTSKTRVTLDGSGGEIYAVAFSPNGQVLASCSRDRTVRLWNSATGKQTHDWTTPSKDVRMLAFTDNDTLAFVGPDKFIRLWSWRK